MDTDDKSSDFEDKTENKLKLIKEISLRPALFNYQLPIEQRTKKIRDSLWVECAKNLQTTIYDCQKRWKNLRDTYHLYRQHHQNLLERWRYTESLSFLQNIHTVKARKKPTTKNVTLLSNSNRKEYNSHIENDYLEDISEIDIDIKNENQTFEVYNVNGNSSDIKQPSERTSRFKRRRTKKLLKKSVTHESDESTKDSDPIMIQNDYNAPGDSQKDEIDLFLDFINKKIRKLPLNDINEIQRKFLDIVVEKELNLAKC